MSPDDAQPDKSDTSEIEAGELDAVSGGTISWGKPPESIEGGGGTGKLEK